MKNLNEFNNAFETWLLSLGFKPDGHEFHMKYRKNVKPYIVTELNKTTNKLQLWLENNLDRFGVTEIHYRLHSNLKLVIEYIKISNEYYNPHEIIYKQGTTSSPSTIVKVNFLC